MNHDVSEVLFINLVLRMTIIFMKYFLKLSILIKHVSRIDPKSGSSFFSQPPNPQLPCHPLSY